jgi:hypothetical protein
MPDDPLPPLELASVTFIGGGQQGPVRHRKWKSSCNIKGREKQHNSNKEQENKNGKLVDEVFHSSLHTVVHSKSISYTMP